MKPRLFRQKVFLKLGLQRIDKIMKLLNPNVRPIQMLQSVTYQINSFRVLKSLFKNSLCLSSPQGLRLFIEIITFGSTNQIQYKY